MKSAYKAALLSVIAASTAWYNLAFGGESGSESGSAGTSSERQVSERCKEIQKRCDKDLARKESTPSMKVLGPIKKRGIERSKEFCEAEKAIHNCPSDKKNAK